VVVIAVEVATIEEVNLVLFLSRIHVDRLGRGGFDRGNQSRFSSRGGGRHDYSSSSHPSSHSPDRRLSSSHDGEKYSGSSSLSSGFSVPPPSLFDDLTHRSIPLEAMRKSDKSNDANNNPNKSVLIVDETVGGGHIG
jgi:hypothetical protein